MVGFVHRQVALRAAAAPRSLALAGAGCRLTYGELNRRANLLARRLRSLGVRPEVAVALVADPVPAAVVGALAVLKAGGCYLPLDPAHPEARLVETLEDAGARLVLAGRAALERHPGLRARTAGLPPLEEAIEPRDEADPGPPASCLSPDNLAYVVYTSGSTGRPKGVEIPHRGLSNLVAWHLATYGVTAADRAARLAGPGFDASVWEVWPFLAAGASLHTPDAETRLSPPRLVAWLAREGITSAFLATPLAEAALEEAWPPEMALRVLLTGGDRLRRWAPEGLPLALVNHYGPTEGSVVATAGRVPTRPARAAAETLPSIGRPISGVRVHLLDPALRPVAPGEAGEIAIGGAGLARGYRRRPGLTAGVFVPDPLGLEPGGRLYRTGDQARTGDGGRDSAAQGAPDLHFLGRQDQQLKVQGVRMEAGEIEAALLAHPAVLEAAVQPWRREGELPRLVAYLVPSPGVTPEPEEIRELLRRRLPEAMVPTAFVLLERLPLTANGKLDRRALPPPPAPLPAEAARRPRTATEVEVARLFAAALGGREVGAEEDFFALGGDSIRGTRVVSRLRAAFGVSLPLADFFARPTVAALARRVDQARATTGAGADLPLQPQPRPAEPPLSFAQERLWFLDRWLPESPLYYVPFALRLDGPLSPAALERALAQVVRRHEVLRTGFGEREGRPVQVIYPVAPAPLPRLDLSRLPAGERDRLRDGLRRRQACLPFDLARPPLLRWVLLVLAPEQHELAATFHHIVCDGWSMWVLLEDLSTLYRAFTAGEPSPLPDLPLQYADFALWQRRRMEEDGIGAAELDYWRRRLGGGMTPPELPFDRPRPPVQSFRGAWVTRRLGAELNAGVEALGQRTGASPFMVLLAAFFALLERYTGARDLAVGSPIANRHRLEVERLIGFFVNTLVLRLDLAGELTFHRLLARVREAALGAFAHQDLPFDRLVAELAPERHLSANPLVQILFALQNAPARSRKLAPGLAVDFEELTTDTTKADLSAVLEEGTDGALALRFEYSTDLFDATTVHRLGRHFRSLLAAALEAPEGRLSLLPLLSAAERQQLVVESNDTAMPMPELPVHRLVEARAAERPDATAVADRERCLTYGELQRRAHRLGRRLRRHEIGPEAVAAIWLPRSPEGVTAALAVLTAGGAYLPIAPTTPAERVEGMLAEARARVLLTDGRGAASPLGFDRLRLRLDAGEAAAGEESGRLDRGAGPGNLAYVIFTSGSTGRPKGVAIEHRSLAALVAWQRRVYAVGTETRGTLVAGPAFDASVWELWSCLSAGGLLLVPGEEAAVAPQRLGDWLTERAATVTFIPTPLAEALLAGGDPRSPSLAVVLTGGDRLHRPPVSDLPFRLFNHYGPTEGTVLATMAPVDPRRQDREPPIGRPVDHTRCHVLDRRLQPVPLGVPGELCLGGRRLARGYLGRPGRTAASFIPDPLAAAGAEASPGGRLYRTGDLVRRLATGELDFLGRADLQVQVRGFRIELGEVEAALGHHPAVHQAVVLARGGGLGRQLVAYVVLHLDAGEGRNSRGEGAAPGPEELRAFLGCKLPDYMVPAAFVFLDHFPLTANGKVDRRALPAPAGLAGDAGGTPPAGPVEAEVARVWRQVLEVETVSRQDDFFQLGGHSLLATRVQSRLRQALGVELPLPVLFEHRRLSDLARQVERALAAGRIPAAPPLLPQRREGEPSCSFSQVRLWFLDRLEPGAAVYSIPVALCLEGPLDAGALERALAEVVRRHEALRTVFPAVGGEPVQRILPGAGLTLPLVELGDLPGAGAERAAGELAGREARRPFDLASGPLFRFILVRLGHHRHRLLVTLHHVVADGWSMGVLERELAAGYRAFAAGERPHLPALPVQFADFALWQRRWLTGEVLATHLAVWRQRLAGLPPVLDLPTDRPRPPTQTFAGAVERCRLPGDLADRLGELGRTRGATPFMVLLAAFQVLLGRYSGQRELAVGTPVAGRRPAAVEGLIGCFVNTLVIRGDLTGRPSFDRLLARVREEALVAFVHQDLPFERLVAELEPGRDLSRTPLFQVFFALQNAARPEGELAPGTRLTLEEVHPGTAKFDLSLFIEERRDGLGVSVEYNTDLFDATTVRRLAGHFRVLLEGVAAGPEMEIGRLPLLTPAEAAQVAAENDDAGRDLPPEALLHAAFLEQVERIPGAVALVRQGESWTYGGLAREVGRQARRLRALGVGPEVRVGLFSHRSPEMVTAMVAVLAAGGAYVPLDPAFPAARIAFTLADCAAQVVVVAPELAASLPAHQARELTLEPARPGAGEAALPPTAVTPDNLAYVIYTSGSTGTPKGVAIEHRSAALMVAWARRRFTPAELARTLAATSICFDLSVFELFAPLAAGGTVVLARDLLELPRLPEASGVTLINTVPSVLAELLRLSPLPARVRTVNLAGEPLPRALADALYALPGVERVDNLYGPSEDTTYSTWEEVTRAGVRPPGIGRPLTGTRAWVVDPDLEPLPAGVPGELCLGGGGLARGYLGRPGRTAESFVPDPFPTAGGGSAEGTRLYRTGDRVRRRPDGGLDYLGRLDRQVKLRGFRIELGEVETALGRSPEVSEAVALVREDRPGDPRLVTYVVAAPGAAPEAEALRRRLAQELPAYMVPGAVVLLAELPRTPGGKVDRRALPAPDGRREEETAPFVAPRTPVEEMVAETFVEVLGVERVGIHDDFFALGGHSLLATRALARLEDLFALEIPLRVLFEAPTVARLVVALGELLLAQSEAQPEAGVAQDPGGGDRQESVAADLAVETKA